MKKHSIFPFIFLMFCCLGINHTVYGAEVKDSEEAFFKAETAEVPIIMYHKISTNNRYIGKHGITPEALESDLKYLQENGYQTVVMADIISFVQKGKNLPKKPIVLTFDDGNNSDYHYLYPLLQKYDMKAVVSVLGHATDECSEIAAQSPSPPALPHLTWDQIKEMSSSKHVEIQNHSYNLHANKGSGQRNNETLEDYHKRLRDDLSKMQNKIYEMVGTEANTFTYPFGIISDNSRVVLEELGMIASLSCRHGINLLKENDPDCLYRLKRINRPSGESISSILRKHK